MKSAAAIIHVIKTNIRLTRLVAGRWIKTTFNPAACDTAPSVQLSNKKRPKAISNKLGMMVTVFR